MADKPNVKVIVAMHKQCEVPSDEIYFPLHVGAEGKVDSTGSPLDLGYQKDNVGDNISEKNFCFGTQTALYWAWKNLNSDYIGLVHYRRYFCLKQSKKNNNFLENVLTGEQLYPLLSKNKVIVPKKRHYYIESIHSHYIHTMNGGDQQLSHTRNIIKEMSPQYLSAYDKFMKKSSAHIFNMMILEKSLFNDYCSWLFMVLFELEKRVVTDGWNDFDKRYAGRVSERLFNVWLRYKLEIGDIKKGEIIQLPYVEDVNFFSKVTSFLKAKFLHRKYEMSF